MLNRNYGNVKSSLKDDVGFVKLRLSESKEWVKVKLRISKFYIKTQIFAWTQLLREGVRVNIKLTRELGAESWI